MQIMDYQQGTDPDPRNMGFCEETSEIYRTSCRIPVFLSSIDVEFESPAHIEEYSLSQDTQGWACALDERKRKTLMPPYGKPHHSGVAEKICDS